MDNKQQIYTRLMDAIGNPYGVCGLMGNIQAESNFNPRNLQNSYEKKLGMDDDTYTIAVDNGVYGNFVHDSAGYGLCQWTYWSRKSDLLHFATERHCSIGDLNMQVDFLVYELRNKYGSVWKVLVSAKSVEEASNAVLLQFERPKDQSTENQRRRSAMGQALYNELAVETQAPVMEQQKYSRQAVVALANSWLGKSEANGGYREIIDIYNSQQSFPRSVKMQYNWPWCACTWSAIAIKLGYTAIMPVEISCNYLIQAAKRMGCWVENDGYTPQPGDAILYDWQDNGSGDNIGTPDHIGTVVEVNKNTGYMVVVEGNYSNAVKKRTIALDGRYIRGFITPRYTDNTLDNVPQVGGKSIETVAREVIAGTWGNGEYRKERLAAAGYNVAEVQAMVNLILNGTAVVAQSTPQSQEQPMEKKVTATEKARNFSLGNAGVYTTSANLYLRNGAGTNKKALALIPKGTRVRCYGYFSVVEGFVNTRWLYIQVIIDGTLYTGFSCNEYLVKQYSIDKEE